ncbi:MAG: 3,4-dihydroxy-2-butanone-4-phosphate synthase [Thermoplasmata archaeon]|nr:3,4-dihydroxy-2-butanone-4-phosphate synthase [Thermoplasmata archaeon]MCJ7561993.1 3,4-dihydroxy-2-butanone-4-phosphate synthase [Thermoplasmata archaeon]
MASDTVLRALSEIKKGHFVLVYDADGREEETDMVIASEFVTSSAIRTLRKTAGGLICTTADPAIRQSLGLPFLTEVFAGMSEEYPVMKGLTPNDIPYDVKSAFGITINHRKTFTGITDDDRALTIIEFAKLARTAVAQGDGWGKRELGKNFRAPGHVHLLNTSDNILETRFGHTELTTALVMMTGLVPSATICEMMGDDGRALSKEAARTYAEKHDLVFIEGKDVIDAWKEFRKG